MRKDQLLDQLNEVERIANYSKLQRFIFSPLRYLYAIGYREMAYPRKKEEKIVHTQLFFGQNVNVALPASTDIYLTKGKSHSSEIRLARFLIHQLQEGDVFVDIGAHIGYFTLLAAKLVGSSGKVLSFEPAPKTFKLLTENTIGINNVSVHQQAVSNTQEDLIFYEFPNYYSEFNTSDISQFENENWFKSVDVQKVIVKCLTLDDIIKNQSDRISIIKIDVEGGEHQVIKGGANGLSRNSPLVVMEYLGAQRSNSSHIQASQLLLDLGYTPHVINNLGYLQSTKDINQYLLEHNSESENIVFSKKVN